MRRAAIAALVLAAVLGVACKADPDAARRQHMARGDAYLADRKPREAIIEFRKAAQADPSAADVQRQLARAYLEVNEPGSAYEAYARAADIDANDTESAIRAGELLLAGGDYERARQRAELLLRHHPRHPDGLVLLGQALAGLKRPEAAIEQIEEAITLDPDSGRAYAALGSVQLSRGDREKAEAAFRTAVTHAPKSRDAHLALANYYLATGRVDEAEQSFRRARDLEPEGELTNRALGSFLVATGRIAEAEPYMIAAGKAHDRARLALADYYVISRQPDKAVEVLQSLERVRDLVDSVQTRLAAIDHAAGRRAEAHARLDRLQEGKTPPARALLLRGRFLLVEGRAEEAAKTLTQAVKAEPRAVAAHYALGLAHLARRNLDDAERAFDTVVRLNPSAAAGRLQLARIALERGQQRRATALAREAADVEPGNPAARLSLVRTLRAAGETEKAQAELDRLLEQQPASALLWVERGALRADQNDLPGARTAFSKAASLAPSSFAPLAGLTMVDLAQGKVQEARQRLDARLESDGDNTDLLLLAGRAALQARDHPAAERFLTRAVSVDPQAVDAYLQLGRLYVITGRLADAQRQFERLEKSRPVIAHTMAGLIHEAQGQRDEARRAYEEALSADPNAVVAANNLAWLRLGTEGASQEVRRLATLAQRERPDQPEMNDTLGWVLVKAGEPARATRYLRRAIELKPESAIYHHHLGIALLESGEAGAARDSLERALSLDPSFNGHEEARAALARLQQAAAEQVR